MGVLIDSEKCIGCGKCRNICPGNIIKTDALGKAFLKKPGDCWSCTSCMKECPVSAIFLSLPVEMGGRGAKLSVEKTGQNIRWTVTRNNEELKDILTKSDEANKY